MFKKLVRSTLHKFGYDIVPYVVPVQLVPPGIPDQAFYQPSFSPWLGYGSFAEYAELARAYTLVSAEKCYILLSLARQMGRRAGDWVECGVYKGGTAMILAKAISDDGLSCRLHLFDTFEGMPETDPDRDWHKKGDFCDTDLEAVKVRVRGASGGFDGQVIFHPGTIPDTFANTDVATISFAHVDVDIYQAIRDCCEFIYPRLIPGGVLLFDDYGAPSCPGARKAVDEFFEGKAEIPLVLATGQAIVVKSVDLNQPRAAPSR